MSDASRKMTNSDKLCVCVVGMHRTGTSALSSLLSGFDFGSNTIDSAYDNPNGFYENKLVVNLNDEILKFLGFRWDTILLLPADWELRLAATEFEEKALEILKSEYSSGKHIAIKDPRLSFLFPFWLKLLTKVGFIVKVLHTYRPALEVVHSLHNRNNFTHTKSTLLYLGYVVNGLKVAMDCDSTVVSFDSLLNERSKVHELINNLIAPDSSIPREES